ncbi:MAG: hypothetical protein A2W91_13620 [Bacteroidetes bacterium GWF2_38_335]|nr:MAG: hypothetical protein A2W91_13620 [Bacteroidetes bacterium GWF2_38_335]OFY77289.1 MAG: hypothetical protein A2281_15285 [Bacteroidetes bacterium RIFOXYA12_FULL_38_20]HBS85706.1 peptidase M16 [Bacteroidales bacterium]
MKKSLFFSLILILFAGLHLSFAQTNLEAKKLVLENGLTVYLSEDHSKPEVFGAVMVKAGGKNDPADATGMAHYQEHMLFKGTQQLGTTDWEKEKVHIDKIFELYDVLGKTTDEEKRKEIQKEINDESIKAQELAIPNELSNLIKSLGGTNLNAGTGPDNTVYYNSFPPSQMERWLDLYSHRFMDPVFRSFQAELEVVYEEKNMYEDIFFFPLLEKFNKSFFKNHPYGQQPLVGTMDHLKNPSLTKMFEFFRTYYVANNMALVIVGDFETENVIPLIEKKFGAWRHGKVPENKVYNEDAFKGRELVEANMSPIKLGVLGFRTVPSGHPDEYLLKICNSILSNQNQTGLLDKLTLDNKIMAAQVFSMPYLDHGATMFLFIPKILGQKLEEGEQLMLAEIEKLKKGEFDNWMVEAFKNDLYMEHQKMLESAEGKALAIAEMFVMGKDVDYLNSIPEEIKKIKKEDVIAAANKYFGPNYLAFFSKMGFPKKNKIEKPGYKPIVSNTEAKSKYAQRFETIPVGKPKEKFINFNKDVTFISLSEGDVYYTKNPANDIYSITLKFGVGDEKMPILKYAANMMNMAGTEKRTVNELKTEFNKLGCSYSIYSDDSYLYIQMEGMELYFSRAIELMKELIDYPALDPKKLENLLEEEKTARKMENAEPDGVAGALLDYVLYKNKSGYIDRLTLDEIKELKADSLVSAFKMATKYQAEAHCVSSMGDETLIKKMAELLATKNKRIPSESPFYKPVQKYQENTVYFVNKKKALQSKIYFFANGSAFNKEDMPQIEAFNLYFGGDFSGLVLQEVREYRSLAYGAGANFSIPDIKGKPYNFIGYVGTQADKTLEALEVFDQLIRDMPKKKERQDMIFDYLKQAALTSQPHFRNLSQRIADWKQLGYDTDPEKYNYKRYNEMTFEEIIKFYEINLKKAPVVVIIVGNKKKIDMDGLQKYGKFIEVKEKALFKN